MDVIYAPRGKAMEYAESVLGARDGLALNIYKTCPHGCEYCYVPFMPFTNEKLFRDMPKMRDDFMKRLENNCEKRFGCRRPLHLCFTCDPYPKGEKGQTREVLLMLEYYNFQNIQILTKGGMRPVRDFDIVEKTDWAFGATIVFTDDEYTSYYDEEDKCHKGWEPYAEPFNDREASLKIAHDKGIRTWLSLEPVIVPDQALDVIDRLLPWVDMWKVGKLNGRKPEHKEIEKSVDWAKFVNDAEGMLNGQPHVFKKSLLKAAGRL